MKEVFTVATFATLVMIGWILILSSRESTNRQDLQLIEMQKQTAIQDSILSYTKSIYNDVRVVR